MVPNTTDPSNETEHTPIQTRILYDLQDLKKSEQVNPQENINSRTQFLSNFDWTDSTLELDAKQAVDAVVVEFYDVFARRRFDNGNNMEFLTPLHGGPAYNQTLPVPNQFKDGILVELALLHQYGIITTLAFSKYASPTFARRKPNEKLRLSVDQRNINTFIADD